MVGGKGRKLDRGRCWSPDLTELKNGGGVGVGKRRQAILPLSIVLNNHCFVWMLLEGVRNYSVKQYRDLTTLEKNSDSLRSSTSILNSTYIPMVPKLLCLALTSSHLSIPIFHYLPSITCILLHWAYFSTSEFFIFMNDPASSTVSSILINGIKMYSFSQLKSLGELLHDFCLSATYNQSPNSANISHKYLLHPSLCLHSTVTAFIQILNISWLDYLNILLTNLTSVLHPFNLKHMIELFLCEKSSLALIDCNTKPDYFIICPGKTKQNSET